MKTSQKIVLGIAGAIILCALFLFFSGSGESVNFGSAPSGFLGTIATTSNPTIGTSAALLFATSTCVARIITTVASPVMLTFSDRIGQTPTATFGHLQPASTTVEYDSGLYGCGAVKAFGFTSSAITVSESR